MNNAGPAPRTSHRQGIAQGPVFLSNLLAGVIWLLVTLIGSWPLALIGLVYVVAASSFFELTTSGGVATVRRLAVLCVPPWFAAVAMWTWVLVGIELPASASDWFWPVLGGLFVGSGCFAVWQVTALLVRQFLPGVTGPRISAPPWAD